MKKVLITGALGQIGSELTERLRKDLGVDNVIATDVREVEGNPVVTDGHFEILDVMDRDKMMAIAKDNGVDTIIHLASLLSAVAEAKPQFAWNLNMGGLVNALKQRVNLSSNTSHHHLLQLLGQALQWIIHLK